jgi:hypothetical protein
MANDPPFAALNHVAGDLGIPGESALLRIGISLLLTGDRDRALEMCQLPSWIGHYNEVHPPKALDYHSPVSPVQLTEGPDRVRSFGVLQMR